MTDRERHAARAFDRVIARRWFDRVSRFPGNARNSEQRILNMSHDTRNALATISEYSLEKHLDDLAWSILADDSDVMDLDLDLVDHDIDVDTIVIDDLILV